MRISKLRALDKLRRLKLETPVYAGGDRVVDWLLAEGLAKAVTVPGGRRIGVSEEGAVALREMADAEAHGNLRGCWGDSVSEKGVRETHGARRKNYVHASPIQ